MAGLDGPNLRAAKADRIGRLKGYGNAIVPALAAEFIAAFCGARGHIDYLIALDGEAA